MATKLIAALLCLAFYSAPAQDKLSLTIEHKAADSVATSASLGYQPHSFLRRFFMGNNYRDAWKEPVTLPVFHFSGSGFQIKELGGGMQTKSLHMIDSTGKEWSLRTIDKDVSAAIPPGIRSRLVLKASQDLISAAFPYASPIAGELVHGVGITAARPRIVFVADDPALDSFRSIFANTLCMLEERDPGFAITDNSVTLADNVLKSSQYKVQQQQLLKARLMDMLMSDWDRHADNWRWGLKDSAGLKYYYGIPRDRDWAFYNSKGAMPKLMRLTGGMRCFISFGPELKNIKDLSWKAWTLDKKFLNELDAAAWQATTKEVQQLLTDSVIAAAVHTMPTSVFAMYGDAFISALKSRRDALQEEVMKYYDFLSEEVIIDGSNEAELFSVLAAGEGLRVVVQRAGSEKQKIYERSFSPSETYFIKLNGLGGNDVFQIDEKAKSKIKLIIDGGDGADYYFLKGQVRTKVHDTSINTDSGENYGQANIHLN